MSILIIGYLEVATTEIEIMRNHRMSTKALYVAEGGVQAGIRHIIDNLLGDNNWGNDEGVIYTDVSLGDGDYDVELKNGTQDAIDVESTGEVSGFTRTIIQTVTRGGSGVPEAFYYAMLSFGSHTNFNNSTGTVDGDVASSGTVQNEDDMTITGTVTDGSTVSEPSPVAMASYKSIADNIESGGFTFTSGNTYGASGSEEIWYIEGNVTIESNVTIYGSVIADNNISMGNTSITIDAASGYPALISGNNIQGDGLGGVSTISGLIYADNNVDFDGLGDDVTINGTIISGNTTVMRNGGDFTVNYDPDIITNPPPYFPGGGITLSAWQENP